MNAETEKSVLISEAIDNQQENLNKVDTESSDEFEDQIEIDASMRSILDQQNIIQFRQYVKEQHPKDIDKQNELIAQMQEHYFEYYVENVHKSQFFNQQRQLKQLLDLRDAAQTEAITTNQNLSEDELADPASLSIIPATLTTRKDIAEFKSIILSTQRECCIKIGSLASATLRVPTHEDGSAIFWEFATDSYDIGFGLYFEWTLTPPDTISMTISESSDEEDDEEEEHLGEQNIEIPPKPRIIEPSNENGDVERGSRRRNEPPTDELIPVYRRDSHLEVYCGHHTYPGCGVYILKFDNSFSLWRSKWLYYRVYYGK